MSTLTNTQKSALEFLHSQGGSVLLSSIMEKSSQDVFGDTVPGIRTYEQLDKLGFLIITEEDPIDIDGEPFTFTPMVELTDTGREEINQR